jgi:hypothetical protein
MWINPDPSQPALAERAPIDVGTPRRALLCAILAIGIIAAASMVLP